MIDFIFGLIGLLGYVLAALPLALIAGCYLYSIFNRPVWPISSLVMVGLAMATGFISGNLQGVERERIKWEKLVEEDATEKLKLKTEAENVLNDKAKLALDREREVLNKNKTLFSELDRKIEEALNAEQRATAEADRASALANLAEDAALDAKVEREILKSRQNKAVTSEPHICQSAQPKIVYRSVSCLKQPLPNSLINQANKIK